jgi:hypothetical protein
LDGQKKAPSLAVLDDSADTEVVIPQQLDGRTYRAALAFGSGSRIQVIDNDVIRPMKLSSRKKSEGPQGVVAGKIDAPNSFNSARRHVEIGDGRRGHGDVRQFRQNIRNLCRNGCASNGADKAGVRRSHDNVCADAAGLVAGVVHHSYHNGDNGQDHHHLDGDGYHADECAQGAVQDIAENEFIHWLTGVLGEPSLLSKV